MAKVSSRDLTFDRSTFFVYFPLALALGVLLNLSDLDNDVPFSIGTFLFGIWIFASSLGPLFYYDRGERLGDFLSGKWILAKPFPSAAPGSAGSAAGASATPVGGFGALDRAAAAVAGVGGPARGPAVYINPYLKCW